MTEGSDHWRAEFLTALEAEPQPSLLRTAMCLSRLLQRGDTWDRFEAELSELEAEAKERVAAAPPDAASGAEAIMQLLVERGFEGNTDDYEAVHNSFMDRVLQCRRGLPISLSVLAIHLGEVTEVPIDGIGFPGHFIVGVELDSKTPTIFDPFNEGRRLSFVDLASLYEAATRKRMTSHAPMLRDALEPAPTRAIISRLLQNLQRHYSVRGSADRAAEVVGLLAVLHPEVTKLRHLQGKLHRRLGELN